MYKEPAWKVVESKWSVNISYLSLINAKRYHGMKERSGALSKTWPGRFKIRNFRVGTAQIIKVNLSPSVLQPMLIRSQSLSLTDWMPPTNCLISLCPRFWGFLIIKRVYRIYLPERLWVLKIMCLAHEGHLITGARALYPHSCALTLSSRKLSSQPMDFEYHLDCVWNKSATLN